MIALPKICSEEQFNLILKAVNKVCTRKPDMYDLAFRIMGYMGFRCGEVTNLKLTDIDWYNNTIKIKEQKNDQFIFDPNDNKIRIPQEEQNKIPPFVLDSLKAYVKKHLTKILEKENYLFFSNRRNRTKIEPANFRNVMDKVRKELGLTHYYNKRRTDNAKLYVISPHTLRHLAGQRVHDRLGTEDTQIFLRHKSPQVTKRYVHTTMIRKEKINAVLYGEDFANPELERLKNEIQELKELLKKAIILPLQKD